MDNRIVHAAAAVVNRIVPVSATIFLHTTVLLSAGLILCHLVRHRGAKLQSCVLKTFLLFAALCPFLVLIGNMTGIRQYTMPVPVESSYVLQPSVSSSLLVTRLISGFEYVKSSEYPSTQSYLVPLRETDLYTIRNHDPLLHVPSNDRNSQKRVSIRSLLYMILCAMWVGATLFFLIRFAFGMIHIWILRRNAGNVDPSLQRAGDWIARRYTVTMPPMFRSGGIRSPLLSGVFKPFIMLPRNIRITADVIVHELSHFINHDCIWNLLNHAAIILFPLQPLLHILSRKLEDVNDYVCDDLVIAESNNPRAYALELISYAERSRNRQPKYGNGVGVVCKRSSLRHRIERIISVSSAQKSYVNTRMTVTVAVVGVILVLFSAFIGFEGDNGHVQSKTVSISDNQLLFVRLPDVIDSTAHLSDAADESTDSFMITENSIVHEGEIFPHDSQTDREIQAEVIQSGFMPVERVEVVGDESDGIIPDAGTSMAAADKINGIQSTASPVLENETHGLMSVDTRDSISDVVGDTDSIHAAIVNPVMSEPGHNAADEDLAEMETDEHEPHAVTEIVSVVAQNDRSIDLSYYSDYDTCMEDGKEYFEETKYFAANELFRKAAAFRPNDAESNFYIAYSYLRLNDYRKAKMFFQITIAMEPKNVEAIYLLGDTIRRMGDLDGAMKQYKLAYNVDPVFLSKQEAVIF